MRTRTPPVLARQLRLRIRRGDEIALGPGKIELLESIQRTGSITQAASDMGISYMRAWTLIRTMNECFKEPLVLTLRGGKKGGGGAQLTSAGRTALELYNQMSGAGLAAMTPEWDRMRKMLKR